MSMTKAIRRRGCALLLVAGLVAANAAPAQDYTAPTVPATSTGSYTVGWLANCGYPPPDFYCAFTWLQERVEPGGAWTTVASSGGETVFAGRAPGTYSYRVYAGGYDAAYNYYELLSPTVSVTVSAGVAAVRDSLRTQMGYRYEVRQGDIDGNGKADFLLRRTGGGTPLNGTVGEVLLRQAGSGGGFAAAVPTAAESQAASVWALAPVEPILSDINVDGFVDVTLSGVPAVAPGAVDQIVYAPGRLGRAEPLAVRAFDSRMLKYTSDMMDYFVYQDYFASTAPVYYYEIWYWYAWCDYFNYSGVDYYGVYDSYSFLVNGCWVDYYYVSGAYQDFSGFSSEAVDFWRLDYAASNGQVDENQAIAEAEADIESVIGIPIGGWDMDEVLGPVGAHRDPFIRRGIDIGQSVLGQARGGRNRTTSRLMPPQLPRVPDEIYITGHPLAFARSRGHLAVEYVDSVVGGLPLTGETLSAEPEYNNALDFGKLIAKTNRPTDDPLLNFYVGDVDPSWTSNRSYWLNRLRIRHLNYIAQPYALKPYYALVPVAMESTHNSNSYIAGLVSDSPQNVDVKVPSYMSARYPGWGKPVPDVLFR